VAGVISPHIDYQRGGPVYAAVWQRAAGAIRGAELVIVFGTDHSGGPGKLTRALRITRKQNALPATRKNGLWVEDRGVVISPRQITRTPRIGVAYAGPVWSAKRWRFVLRNPVSPERRSTSSRSHLSKPRRDLRASFG